MTATRHDHNPFTENMVVNVRDKKVTTAVLGKGDNTWVNHSTGEVAGSHLVTHKRVDSSEFVKLFTKHTALMMDLNKAGTKTLVLLMWAVQHTAMGKDLVILNQYTLGDFLKQHDVKAFSYAVFKRGLNELEEAQIIAKARQRGYYYINPNFLFNGDRIAFTKVIERAD